MAQYFLLWRIFGVAGHGRRRHHLADLVLLEEVGQVDVVAPGRAGAEPLRVADDHVVGIALGVELGERLGLEIRPWNGFDFDLDAGLLLVVLDQLLQVVGRIPFRPEDRERLGRASPTTGQQQQRSSHNAQALASCHDFLLRVFRDIAIGRAFFIFLECTAGGFLVNHVRRFLLARSASASSIEFFLRAGVCARVVSGPPFARTAFRYKRMRRLFRLAPFCYTRGRLVASRGAAIQLAAANRRCAIFCQRIRAWQVHSATSSATSPSSPQISFSTTSASVPKTKLSACVSLSARTLPSCRRSGATAEVSSSMRCPRTIASSRCSLPARTSAH